MPNGAAIGWERAGYLTDDDTFDIVHAHQVLQPLPDPVAALREMKRVCKPGGMASLGRTPRRDTTLLDALHMARTPTPYSEEPDHKKM